MQGYNNLRRNSNGFGGNWSRPGANAGAAYGQYGQDPNYYGDPWGDNGSGRRYYDSEKEKAIHKLHSMMESTDDPERKNVYRIAIHELEQK